MPGLSDACAVCRQKFPFSLPRCSMCHKAVCGSCGTRMGGTRFCSKACGHSFFYGGSPDVDESDREEEDDE